jgi:ribosomal protein S18 acetylase RimI-like enzyme
LSFVRAKSDRDGIDSVKVRRLRWGEDALWRGCRCGDWPPDGPEFTRDPGFRSEAHLVAERAGRIVGRMESVLNEPYSAVLIDPIVCDGEDVEEVASVLIDEGLRAARSIGAAQIELILESYLPYLERLGILVAKLGFRRRFEKALYARDLADFPTAASARPLEFRTIADMGDAAAIRVIGDVLKAPLNRFEMDVAPESMFQQVKDLCHRNGVFHPEDWLIAFQRGREVGIVMPALTELVTRRGTIMFVGVIPEARGRGLGLALTVKGIQTIASRTPKALLDSTDLQNAPMRKIFGKLGYRLTAIQHYFEWHTTGV